MEGVFRFKSWCLNVPGLIHGGLIIGILRYMDNCDLFSFCYFDTHADRSHSELFRIQVGCENDGTNGSRYEMVMTFLLPQQNSCIYHHYYYNRQT